MIYRKFQKNLYGLDDKNDTPAKVGVVAATSAMISAGSAYAMG